MADELEILTENADGNSWADSVPGAVSTGYQAQNTNIDGSRLGMDSTVVEASGSTYVTVKVAGVVDVDGLPFVIKTDTNLTVGTYGVVHWIKLAAGTTALEKTLVLTSEEPIWSSTKNGFYTAAGERVLNWMITPHLNSVYMGYTVYPKVNRMENSQSPKGSYLRANSIDSYSRMGDLAYARWLTFPGASNTFAKGAARGMGYDSPLNILWLASPEDARIYRLNRDTGATLGYISMASGTTIAVDMDSHSDNLVSLDTSTNTVNVHNARSATITLSVALPGTNPSGMAYNHITKELLTVDATTRLVYVHSGATTSGELSTISRTIAITGAGIIYDIAISAAGDLLVINGSNIDIHEGITATVQTSFPASANQVGMTVDIDKGGMWQYITGGALAKLGW